MWCLLIAVEESGEQIITPGDFITIISPEG
jgi:hypothetical protein